MTRNKSAIILNYCGKKYLKRFMLTTLIFASLLANQYTNAALLIFFDEDGFGDNPRGLYNYNTDTGIATLRATIPGDTSFFSMDTRPSDMTVFACDVDYRTVGGLWTIDIDTGIPTYIGPTGIMDPVGLAFDPVSEQLFGLQNSGQLYSVDTSSGAFTLIGSTHPVIRGLSFSPDGQLFGFTINGYLYLINPTDGSTTLVGGTADLIEGNCEDSTFTQAGELYVTDYLGTIFRIEPLTGNAVTIGTTGLGSGLLGIIEIPEPATLLLLGLGGLALLRKRKA